MGAAAEIARQQLPEYETQIAPLRDRLEAELTNVLPDCRINGQKQPRLPNTANVSFRYLEGESILVLLDQQDISASTGSACTAGLAEPSHVLRAMAVPVDWLQGAVRFSLSRFSVAADVDYVVEHIPAIVQRLGGLSALGKIGSGAGRNPPAAANN